MPRLEPPALPPAIGAGDGFAARICRGPEAEARLDQPARGRIERGIAARTADPASADPPAGLDGETHFDDAADMRAARLSGIVIVFDRSAAPDGARAAAGAAACTAGPGLCAGAGVAGVGGGCGAGSAMALIASPALRITAMSRLLTSAAPTSSAARAAPPPARARCRAGSCPLYAIARSRHAPIARLRRRY